MTITLYHNPRCSKSRQTLELIRHQGIEPVIIEYLKTPPDAATLASLLKKLGISARQLLRSKEQAYQDAGLDNPALSDDALIAAMVKQPKLIERPIAVQGDKAIIGRPPENVLNIL